MIILVISYLCFPFNGKDTGIGHQRRLDGEWGTAYIWIELLGWLFVRGNHNWSAGFYYSGQAMGI